MEDTVNEASLEEEEYSFWKNTVKIDQSDQKKAALDELVFPLLELFGRTFLPHIGDTPFTVKKRRLDEARYVVRKQIEFMLDKARQEGTRIIPDTTPQNVEKIVQAIGEVAELYVQKSPLADQKRAELENIGIQVTTEYLRSKSWWKEFQDDLSAKLSLLAYMCVKILRVELGVDTLDDRDSLANQMYEDAGILMTSRYASMLRQLESSENLKKVAADLSSVKSELIKLGSSIITAEFSANFTSGEWNKRGVDKKRHGVTDIMPFLSDHRQNLLPASAGF